jgi:hypothetical protein
MPELNPPQERESPIDDPLLASIKASLGEVLRTAEQARTRLRTRAAILRELARDEEEAGEDSDEAIVELGGRTYRLNTRPGASSFPEDELEVHERFIHNQQVNEGYRRLTGWYKPARCQGPTYGLE